MAKAKDEHQWKFVQKAGLVQVQISTVEDVLNLDKLDPKLWTALACPVSGLEFSDETLALLDLDHNGRVRIEEVLEALQFLKKNLVKPEVIMEPGTSIPLDALSDEVLDGKYSPRQAAAFVLEILGKTGETEISLENVKEDDKLFSSGVLNGDGVITADCVENENASRVVKEIVESTGGVDDISGVKGINREQFQNFFEEIRRIKNWREDAVKSDPKIFFLKEKTDTAADSYLKLRDKINDYYLRCSLLAYDSASEEILKQQAGSVYLEDGKLSSLEKLAELPLAQCHANQPLPLAAGINPAWEKAVVEFAEVVVRPMLGHPATELEESTWRKIEKVFAPYVEWHDAQPESVFSGLSLERISEILSSDAESVISDVLQKEESAPPVAASCKELKKLLLLRRDYVELLRNFVCFEDFYIPEKKAIFQCGTLYIDGRSCDLCFKVLDTAKHAVMASLSQCFLIYCDLVKKEGGDKMQIAALISDGATENIIVGRNGVFYDRKGEGWDATIVRIVENPISVKQAFFSPYKKLGRMIQEKIAKSSSAAEEKVLGSMSETVNDPTQASGKMKKIDVGTVAAISVAFTGVATLVGTLLQSFFGLGKFIPLGILGILLIISLPSVIIAWRKLRQRNIAPILDASGWAINGNVKISPAFGTSLTKMAKRPASAYVSFKDPYAQKKFPIKRILLGVILLALIIWFVVSVFKNENGVQGVWQNILDWFKNFGDKFGKAAKEAGEKLGEAAASIEAPAQ